MPHYFLHKLYSLLNDDFLFFIHRNSTREYLVCSIFIMSKCDINNLHLLISLGMREKIPIGSKFTSTWDRCYFEINFDKGRYKFDLIDTFLLSAAGDNELIRWPRVHIMSNSFFTNSRYERFRARKRHVVSRWWICAIGDRGIERNVFRCARSSGRIDTNHYKSVHSFYALVR